MNLLASILLATIPLTAPIVRESVEIIEINNYHDEHGRKVFCQWVAWQADGRCIAWRMNPLGALNPVGGVTWFNDSGTVRRIEARTAVETWTQHDPELADREVLCKDKRRELRTH